MQYNRHIGQIMPPIAATRRLLLLTGARQTGKTTLVKRYYSTLPYFNLDAPEIRDLLLQTPTMSWPVTVGDAVLDEIQKLPQLFEKIKYNYDANNINFSLLTGSSQILLLSKVSESLAGRIAIYELFPLMLSELIAEHDVMPKPPLLNQLLQSTAVEASLQQVPAVIVNGSQETIKSSFDYLGKWGGMPALKAVATDDERIKWLRDYEYTYLQRDLADLARLHDLEPFRRFQKLAALRVASLINFSELASDAGISVDTARRYLEYLKISYQVVLLQPYYKNLTNSVVKTPKLYWLDMGIARSLMGIYDGMTGSLFENLIISEIIKWLRTTQAQADLYFYRTHSGAEVDLLMKTPHGIIGVEVKAAQTVTSRHTKTLRDVANALGDEWLGGVVVYCGDVIKELSPTIWCVPAWRLLS